MSRGRLKNIQRFHTNVETQSSPTSPPVTWLNCPLRPPIWRSGHNVMWMSLHVTTTLRTDIVIWDHRKLLHTDVIPLMLFHPPDMMHLHSVMDVLQTQMETISWVTDVGICPLSCLLVCPPQVGVSVMDSISPHTASASWYKAAPLWTWMETQLLFGFVYMSERERERERDRGRKRRKGATVSVSHVAWIQAAVNGDR